MGVTRRSLPLAAAAAAVRVGKAQEGKGRSFAAWPARDLLDQRKAAKRPWLQFFDNATMYLGMYSLEAGAEDRQRPHKEDEIYYVLSGRARFRAGGEEVAVEPGSVLFVKAQVEHRFHSITEPLDILVFFSKMTS